MVRININNFEKLKIMLKNAYITCKFAFSDFQNFESCGYAVSDLQNYHLPIAVTNANPLFRSFLLASQTLAAIPLINCTVKL